MNLSSPPASPSSPVPPQRLLARLTFDTAPPPASSTGHEWQGSAFTRAAEASGRATWGRASSANGEPLFDMPMEPLDVEAGLPCIVSPISIKHLR